jgi:nucleoside permease NupC
LIETGIGSSVIGSIVIGDWFIGHWFIGQWFIGSLGSTAHSFISCSFAGNAFGYADTATISICRFHVRAKIIFS